MAKGVWRPRSERLAREDYLDNAHVFAHRTPKKLTAEIVRQIRENREGMSDKKRAELLGVGQQTVYRVRHYLTWSSV